MTSNLNGFDITLPAIILEKITGLTGTMHCDIFRSITRLQTVLLHSIHCKHQFRILQYIIFVYKTNHVCDFITHNYTSMTHCVLIYKGTLTRTMHYDIFRSITRLKTVLLHSIHCKHQFRILQYIIFVYTN